MERRFFIKNTLFAGATTTLMAAGIPAAFSKTENAGSNTTGLIVHSVYFWLKKGISASDEREFLKYFDLLKKIPGAKSLQFGKAAATTPRPVTDNTFNYNLIITFDSLKAIKIYETHPDHLRGAKEFEKYWDRVQVRDTVLS
ncbi:Dabb family protein [Pedobacter sp. AW1-32]|uniref:Dabb family protein n=1 Tax=Pedobacter sp. AW1-32 TaxID=3383026 RepID=UPI003FF0BF12